MTDQKKNVSRKWLYIPYVAAAILLLGYYLVWREAGNRIETGVINWVADQNEAGNAVVHGDIKKSGFPFFLRVHIDRPNIQLAGQTYWSVDRLTIDALPYQLDRLIFSPVGSQTIESDVLGRWKIESDDFRASIKADKKRDWVFSTTIENLIARNAELEDQSVAQSIVFDLAPATDDRATLTVNAALSGIDASIGGTNLQVGHANAILALSQTGFLSDPVSARYWGASGGELTIHRLIGRIEETDIDIAGAISLDNAGRPIGVLNSEIKNPAGVTEWLGKAGFLNSDDAQSAAAGLSLTAIAGGGKITAPIDFRDGAASIAGIKIMETGSLLPPGANN